MCTWEGRSRPFIDPSRFLGFQVISLLHTQHMPGFWQIFKDLFPKKRWALCTMEAQLREIIEFWPIMWVIANSPGQTTVSVVSMKKGRRYRGRAVESASALLTNSQHHFLGWAIEKTAPGFSNIESHATLPGFRSVLRKSQGLAWFPDANTSAASQRSPISEHLCTAGRQSCTTLCIPSLQAWSLWFQHGSD